MIRLSLLAAVFLVASGCDTVGRAGVPNRTGVDVAALSHDADALDGRWTLTTITPSGECMGDGCAATRSAQEAGRTAEIVFSEDGTAVYTRNGDVLAEGAYEVRPATPESGGAYLVIGPVSAWFGVDGDHLYLDDRYVDGELLEFERLTVVAL